MTAYGRFLPVVKVESDPMRPVDSGRDWLKADDGIVMTVITQFDYKIEF